MRKAEEIGANWAPFTLYAAIFTLIGAIAFLPELLPTKIGTGYIAIFLTMTFMSILCWRREIISPIAMLFLALLISVSLGFILPYSSNDSERYLWDGAVFLSGFDPYVTAPNDPNVARLRDIWPTPAEHAKYPTLYPPGGLSLFAICALAGPDYGIWVWKSLTTLAVILTLIISYKLLIARGLTRHFPLIALSPILLFETQIGAHLDIFSLLGIITALWCLERDKIFLAGMCIGLAATTKFLPAVIVGPFLLYLRPKQALKLFVSAAVTWLGIYAVMFGLGYKPLGLLPTFFEKWRGGAPLFPVLESAQSMVKLSNRSFIAALGALAVAGFGLSAWLAYHRKIDIALALALSVPLLLSPVLFPWYMLALVPFLALRPSYTLFAAMTLAPLNYVVLDRWLSEGVWQQSAWPAQIQL